MRKFLIPVLLLLFAYGCAENQIPVETQTLFIGTYTDGSSEGIYTLQFNPETGTLDSLELKAKLPNPSFLAISKDKKNLFAVQETADFDSLGGGITSFSLQNDELKILNSKGSGGAHPCHVAVSSNNQIAVSNYTGGNLAIFDLGEDGSLAERQLIEHNVDTLKTAHVHKAHFNEDGLFVADLGLSALKRYDKQPYGWVPAHQNTIEMGQGAGSRHFVFSENKAYLYVLNELNATIVVLKRDDEGSYNIIQTAATNDDPKWCADIHLSSDGKFLYSSNRGKNTIVIYTVDAENGEITFVGNESTRGNSPRNFTIDPTGKFVLAGNQKSDNITVFRRDAEKGTLEFLKEYKVPSPVCLVFL
ncbi:lactonase family protein [uncultured Croceitalea sp.]|uniref:lactonase family protein n=1 Tax=uncultured Croceitalea sp. TaxID=1798908 RepID=UPI003305FA72